MLTLFRRHTRECRKGPEGKPEIGLDNRRPKLTSEKMRTWPHCKCPVWFSGTWNNVAYPRTSLKINDWKTAERALQEKMKQSNQSGLAKAITLVDALARWIKSAENDRLADRT